MRSPVEANSDPRFFEALVALPTQDVPGFLNGVLTLVRATTGARVVYMALGTGAGTQSPAWHAAQPAERQADVLERISTGIIQLALEQGQPVLTTNAQLDARLAGRTSVKRNRIEAAYCVPIGVPRVGVLYLQDPEAGGAFTDGQRELVRHAASVMGPLCERIARQHQLDAPDPTSTFRTRFDASAIVGASPAIASLLERVSVAAQSLAPILLTGQTGVGKSAVARVVHGASQRTGPLVTVDCTQLTGERLVADLFGARAGSYTGITRDRPGLIEQASRGTLFLDEVGELSPASQAQLLRFVQDGQYRWLGDHRDRRAPEVRIVAATNVDLEAAVQDGGFRADLYYRLAVFPIQVPAIADRRSDLPLLAHALLARAAGALAVRALPAAPSALAVLEARDWPGNVRELDNVLRAALLWANAEQAPAVQAHHLDRQTAPAPQQEPGLAAATRAFKRRWIQRAIEAESGNKTRAAERLGIGRSSLYELMATLDL